MKTLELNIFMTMFCLINAVIYNYFGIIGILIYLAFLLMMEFIYFYNNYE